MLPLADLVCRSVSSRIWVGQGLAEAREQAPDPSKAAIQQQLQKARQAAGPDSYIAAIYCGHGIQEAPTDAGELWCYDVSFAECVKNGGSPSEWVESGEQN